MQSLPSMTLSEESGQDEPYNRNGGFCECGCGSKTRIINGGVVGKIGEPARFIRGHSTRKFKDGERMGRKSFGYAWVRSDSSKEGRIQEHIYVAERSLGKKLPEGAVVHHINGDRYDNRRENLVVCQNDPFHHYLHQRARAFYASGHANWRKCRLCKEYDDPANLKRYTYGEKFQYSHARCNANRTFNRNHRLDPKLAFHKRTKYSEQVISFEIKPESK